MIKRLAQAFGFAAILLLPNYVDLTSAAGDERMRSPAPLTKIALAQITDLVIVALVFLIVMALLRTLKWWPKLRWILMAALPPFLLVRNLNVFPFPVPDAEVLVACLLWFMVLGFLMLRRPSYANKLRHAGGVILTGFAVFAMVITAQLIRAAIWHPGPQVYAASISAQPATKPRLVWVLFDELAYKPVFESRDPSLNLPNFDRVRDESTVYSEVSPIAYWTNQVVPSLQLGRVVKAVTYTSDHRYLIRTIDSPHWETFDVNASLFGMAHKQGLTVSIAGWCIPYCPLFAGTATQCYWADDDAEDRGPTSLDASFAENVWFPLRILAEQYTVPSKAWADAANWRSKGHIDSVKDVSEHALEAISTSQADIIYVHLPVPHPPEFWNRRTHTFGPGGSYLDSLDYADRLLGQILDVLQAQPRWPATTLIVQGDHSWRTHLWRRFPGAWSAEDERVSHGGQWDPRPLLLIHAAGQKQPKTDSSPTNLMFVHDFVAAEIQSMPQ